VIGILGASGFIGRSVTDYLGARGHPYVALLRDPYGAPDTAFPNATHVHAFEVGGDMNLALLSGIKTLLITTSATKPNLRHNGLVNEVQKNVLTHCQLIDALKRSDVRHLIYLSSGGAVYGNVNRRDPIKESQPRHPCTHYGFGKMCIELAIETEWKGDGRRFTILRPSNPVGAHQLASLGAHGLFPTVIDRLLQGKPIQIFGDGETVRDYFAVEDLCDLIWRVATGRDRGNQVINAASGQGYSINQVVQSCADALGLTAKTAYRPDLAPEISFNVLSNEKARRLFDWRPQTDPSRIATTLCPYVQGRKARPQ
jgi:UDP-glucose 4-epimerase